MQCEDDGSFSNKQCHQSSGYCWCVNYDGIEIKGTLTQPGIPLDCQIKNNQKHGLSFDSSGACI